MGETVRHGDIVLLEAENDHPTAHAIAVLDGTTWGGVSYSHAGFVRVAHDELWLTSARLNKGVVTERLADLNRHRAMLVLRHNGGRRVIDQHLGSPPGRSKFAFGQLLMSAIVAPIRQRGGPHGPAGRFAWEQLHRASRTSSPPVACCCWPKPPRPPEAKWYCAAFVDHEFRANGSCLGIREPCRGFAHPFDQRLGDHLAAALVALFLDFEDDLPDDVLETWLFLAGDVAELVGVHRAELAEWESEGEGDVDDPSDEEPQAEDEPDGPGPMLAATFGPQIRFSDFPNLVPRLYFELALTSSPHLPQLLQLAFDYLDHTFVTHYDLVSAPHHDEPMWPPFMSLSALIGRFAAPIPVGRNVIR